MKGVFSVGKMAVILQSDHEKIFQPVKHRARWSNIARIVIALGLVFMFSSMPSHEVQFSDLRKKIFRILRTKPLTLGQALDISQAIADQKEIPASLILAIIDTESDFRIKIKSRKSCRGLMQLSPQVWKIFMGKTEFKDLRFSYDPILNVKVGIRYLQDLFIMYDMDLEKALKHYYTGRGNIKSKNANRYVRNVMDRAKAFEGEL
jgi:soluble lytic murein transglycosylase-like protein